MAVPVLVSVRTCWILSFLSIFPPLISVSIALLINFGALITTGTFGLPHMAHSKLFPTFAVVEIEVPGSTDVSAWTRYTIVTVAQIAIFIPESERYHAPFVQPVLVERSVDPGGVEFITNPVNHDGISSVTGIAVSATFPVLVSEMVYSKISPIIPSQPFTSITLIVSSRSGILRIKAVVLLASI